MRKWSLGAGPIIVDALKLRTTPEVEAQPGPLTMAKEDPFVRIQRDIKKGVAEFVRGYRKDFRRAGMLDFDLPRHALLPPWMAVVLETLKGRPRTWSVKTLKGPNGGKRFRVIWTRWSTYAPLKGKKA